MTKPWKPKFAWAEFLDARAEMIGYFRREEGLTFEQIAAKLSCDPQQCLLIYMGREEREQS